MKKRKPQSQVRIVAATVGCYCPIANAQARRTIFRILVGSGMWDEGEAGMPGNHLQGSFYFSDGLCGL